MSLKDSRDRVAETLQEQQGIVSLVVCVFGILIYAVLTFFLPHVTQAFSLHYWYNFWLLALIALCSGMLGWGSGILLTPIGPQAGSARTLASAFGSFWTGVVVSHIEVIARTVRDSTHGGLGQAMKVRLLYGGGIFLMAMFVAINSRFPKQKDELDAAKADAVSSAVQ